MYDSTYMRCLELNSQRENRMIVNQELKGVGEWGVVIQRYSFS